MKIARKCEGGKPATYYCVWRWVQKQTNAAAVDAPFAGAGMPFRRAERRDFAAAASRVPRGQKWIRRISRPAERMNSPQQTHDVRLRTVRHWGVPRRNGVWAENDRPPPGFGGGREERAGGGAGGCSPFGRRPSSLPAQLPGRRGRDVGPYVRFSLIRRAMRVTVPRGSRRPKTVERRLATPGATRARPASSAARAASTTSRGCRSPG
jgi:hypothetical protein